MKFLTATLCNENDTMKEHSFILLLGLTLLSGCASVDFINEYKSETEYVIETKTNNEISVEYFGSDDFIKSLESRNIDNPSTTSDSSMNKIAFRTGELKEEKFPVEITYIETGIGQLDAPIQNGDKFFGTYGTNFSLSLHDLSRDEFTESEKTEFLKILEAGFSMDVFQGKRMKIGDTLVRNIPMSFPMAGTNFELNTETIYKLESIKKGSATFSITQLCSANTNRPEVSLIADGTGAGSCVYDIESRRILLNQSRLILDVRASFSNGASVKINLVSKTNVTTIVYPN